MAFMGGGHHVSHGSQFPDVSGIINCSAIHNSTSSRWIVDRGATNHMVSNHRLLYETQNVSPTESHKVYLPNGQQIPIALIGKSKLKQGNISNVLYIPNFSYNLLLVSQLTKELHCCMVTIMCCRTFTLGR